LLTPFKRKGRSTKELLILSNKILSATKRWLKLTTFFSKLEVGYWMLSCCGLIDHSEVKIKNAHKNICICTIELAVTKINKSYK